MTPLRLLSFPARHPYVDAVRPADVQRVHPDRTVGWEPDPLWDPAALTVAAGEADLVHVHFGYDHLDPAGMQEWTTAAAAAGLPVVVTVHDLRNPHHDERSRHDAVLAVLLAAATTVLTLTPGAAAEIADRFGVTVMVLPHPTLVDPRRTDDIDTEPGLVVLHLKSLRRNLSEPVAVARAAADGVAAAGGRLRIDVHPEVIDRPELAGLTDLGRRSDVELAVHERFDDVALERYLRAAQVTVLPHRWGTHSGWSELARDLGTRVVAPDCGHYTEQWDATVSYVNNERCGLDEQSLTQAVATAVRLPAPAPADREIRLREADRVRAGHAAIYDAAVQRR